jgi:hypothetical protein
VNRHEWAKQQMKQAGLAFESLDNGFLQCHQPERLQAICSGLGPEQVQAFFDKWVTRLPWPLTAEDRQAGYSHRLSIWQMEVSRTQVFMQPLRGREFFEQIIRENLDLGRPDRVQLIFGRQVRRNTPSQFRTQVMQTGVQPTLHVLYKHSSVKQYFKENCALRTETTINNPHDFGVDKGLRNWLYLRQLGIAINRRLLETEQVSQDCLLSSQSFERVSEPATTENGQRAPGLRFGQPRVMALFAALWRFAPGLNGFRQADVREIVTTRSRASSCLSPSSRPCAFCERLTACHRSCSMATQAYVENLTPVQLCNAGSPATTRSALLRTDPHTPHSL